MNSFQPSSALLRTRIVSRSERANDDYFETGAGTKPASRVYEKQTSARAADRVVQQARRKRVTREERSKEIQSRRKWSSGGNMPPEIRECYSEAERAALAVIADRCRQKGFCDLSLDEISAISGVKRTSIQNAIRKARSKGFEHISVRERPQASGKNLTNIIKIISKAWFNWIKRAIGFKCLSTSVSKVKTTPVEIVSKAKSAFERAYAGYAQSPSNRPDQLNPNSGATRYGWRRASTAAHS